MSLAAGFAAALADPSTTLAFGLCALAIIAGAFIAALHATQHDDPPAMRTADHRRIEHESQAALRGTWAAMSPLKSRVDLDRGECSPACSPRACDTNTKHCARLREGRKVVSFQRLALGEREAIQVAARIAALEDHANDVKQRPVPMPSHTRAAAVWTIEYEHQRHMLDALERAA